MTKKSRSAAAMVRCLLAGLATAAALSGAAFAAGEDDPVSRGAYLFAAGGCLGCHTKPKDGVPLAGGRPLETPFGTFISPNITPDPDHGLGAWSEADFVRAMREGRAPDGGAYYPVFPFTSFTGMTDADVKDLWAYLQSDTSKNSNLLAA